MTRLHDIARAAVVGALVLAGLLAACETVVDVSLPASDDRLVAHAFFSPGAGWAVRVTQTVPYADTARPAYVENATVEIWQGGRLVAQPARSDSGTYTAQAPAAVGEVPYRLRVQAPGFEPIEGTDAAPPPVPLAGLVETSTREPDGLSRRRRATVEVTLDDPAGTDHYGLFVVQARLEEDRAAGTHRLLPPTLFTFESDDPTFGQSLGDLVDTDLLPYRQAFFDDGTFDGTQHTLTFDLQYDAPRVDAERVVYRQFFLVLLRTSADFHRHWTSASDQGWSNDNPFAEPIRVHSNLEGGHGIFAGFTYQVVPLRIGDAAPALEPFCALMGGRLPVCITPP